MKRLPVPVSFEWGEGNINKSFIKHNVGDKKAEEVFHDTSLKIFEDTKHSQKEHRFVAYGVTNSKRKLIVIFTIRKEKVRIISARDQNKKERIVYEEKA